MEPSVRLGSQTAVERVTRPTAASGRKAVVRYWLFGHLV